MNEDLIFSIIAKLDGFKKQIEEVKKDVKSLGDGVKNTGKEVDTTTKKTKNFGDIFTKAVKPLDKYTFGLASGFAKMITNINLSTVAVRAFTLALLATGILAIVVAVGALVAYWDDIVKFATGYDNKLKDSLDKAEDLGDQAQRAADRYKDSKNSLLLAGKTQTQINESLITSLKLVKMRRIEEAVLLTQQIQGVRDYRASIEKFITLTQSVALNLFRTLARGFDSIFDTGLEDKIGEIAKTSREWLMGFVADTEESDEKLEKLADTIIKTENEIAGLKLSNIGIAEDAAAKTAKELAKVAAELQRELDRQAAITLKVDAQVWKDFSVEEIFDLSGIPLVEQAYKDIVPGVDEAYQAILKFETLLERQADRFKEFKRDFKDIFSADELTQFANLSGEALDKITQDLEETKVVADAVANGVGNGINALFSSVYDTVKTGNKILDGFLASFLGVFEQIAATLLTSYIIEKIVGTGKKAVQFGVSQANAITAATATAAMIPYGAFALPGMIAAAMGSVATAFAGISAFAMGGFSGDKNLVRVNGNELIINPMQQATLFNLLKGTLPGRMQGASRDPGQDLQLNGSWKLKGSDAILMIERAKRKGNRFG